MADLIAATGDMIRSYVLLMSPPVQLVARVESESGRSTLVMPKQSKSGYAVVRKYEDPETRDTIIKVEGRCQIANPVAVTLLTTDGQEVFSDTDIEVLESSPGNAYIVKCEVVVPAIEATSELTRTQPYGSQGYRVGQL